MQNRMGGAARGESDYQAPFKINLSGFYRGIEDLNRSLARMGNRIIDRNLKKKGLSRGVAPRLGPPTDI